VRRKILENNIKVKPAVAGTHQRYLLIQIATVCIECQRLFKRSRRTIDGRQTLVSNDPILFRRSILMAAKTGFEDSVKFLDTQDNEQEEAAIDMKIDGKDYTLINLRSLSYWRHRRHGRPIYWLNSKDLAL
jgi:hypothetical protein